MNRLKLSSLLLFTIIFLGFIPEKMEVELDYNETVRSVLDKLDSDISYNHEINKNIKGASEERGKEIFHNGFTRSFKGKKTKRISKHFVCTSCHNVQREDPDLSIIDPQQRLDFTNALGLPFLQGSSMYGIVNRNSFYNNDYEKKYGKLVDVARNDLREAIQLCSTECSSGRSMKNWELESVLMYLWSLELKINDLEINGEEEQIINEALNNRGNTKDAANLIESKYLKNSPAHFIEPPSDREARSQLIGDATNGALIYENSCLHCHKNRRYSFFKLDKSKGTFKNLAKNLDNYHNRSIYQVSRYGTSPVAGKKAYMPQYTVEKMSEKQLEDLKSYIVRESHR